MNYYTLDLHPKGYSCSLTEWALSPLISPYAQRHDELGQSLKIEKNRTWLGHKIIAFIEHIPLIGLLASLIERVCACIINRFHKSKPTQSPLNVANADEEPSDFDWKILAQASKKREQAAYLLLERFYRLSYKQDTKQKLFFKQDLKTPYDGYMGHVFSIPAQFGEWMPGVALVASQLAEKKKLQGLNVCLTLEALSTKLHEIALDPHDQRCSFIVSAFMSGFQPHYNYKPNFPQHKCAVCVEKKNGVLAIALLDGQPMFSNREIRPKSLINDIWTDFTKPGAFNVQEVVFRAILKGIKSLKTQTRLMHSQVDREKEFGCEVFALQDAIAFLRDPAFFQKVICSNQTVKTAQGLNIEVITSLPPEFMVGTQSYQALDLYMANTSDAVLNQPLIGRKNNQSIKTFLAKNQIIVASLEGIKPQNHYVTRKSFKYMHAVIKELETKTSKDLQNLAEKTLLTQINSELFPRK